MFLFATIILFLTFYNFRNFISTKIINRPLEIINYYFGKNIEIMVHLGYFGININEIKATFIYECVNYLLFSHSPHNIVSEYDFSGDFYMDENLLNAFYNDFEIYCKLHNKQKFDLTINEIINFIKNQDVYKKLEIKLNNKLSRAIILSKYLNENTTTNLINALTDEEKSIILKHR